MAVVRSEWRDGNFRDIHGCCDVSIVLSLALLRPAVLPVLTM